MACFSFNVVLIRGSWLLVLSGNSVKYHIPLEEQLSVQVKIPSFKLWGEWRFVVFNVSMRKKRSGEGKNVSVRH